MSPMIGESLSVTIQGERILLMSSHKQWSSPMSATYENQALVSLRLIFSGVMLLIDIFAKVKRARQPSRVLWRGYSDGMGL